MGFHGHNANEHPWESTAPFSGKVMPGMADKVLNIVRHSVDDIEQLFADQLWGDRDSHKHTSLK